MIFDAVSRFKTYIPVHPLFKVVSDFLESRDLSSLPAGRLDIDRGVYVIKKDYVTVDMQPPILEGHRRYIDLHMVDEGSEIIGFCNRDDCIVVEPYNEEKDFENLDGVCSWVILNKGNFAVFFPQDSHIPGLHCDTVKQTVKKIVFKIPVS
jgi:YhcH/YjgK/YiaL family protein